MEALSCDFKLKFILLKSWVNRFSSVNQLFTYLPVSEHSLVLVETQTDVDQGQNYVLNQHNVQLCTPCLCENSNNVKQYY